MYLKPYNFLKCFKIGHLIIFLLISIIRLAKEFIASYNLIQIYLLW